MKHARHGSILVAVLLAGTAIPAHAVETDVLAQSTMQKNQISQGLASAALGNFGPSLAESSIPDRRTVTPDGATGDSAVTVTPQIVATSDGSLATLKLANSLPWQDSSIGADGSWEIGLDSWSVAISSPLDKSGSATQILGSGGLPGDFVAKFSFSRFIGHVQIQSVATTELLHQAVAVCAASHKINPETFATAAAYRAALYTTCESLNGSATIAKYTPEALPMYNNLNPEYALLWGVDATVGYKKFSFFDAMTAAKSASTGTPWSAGGYFAYSPDNELLLSGAFEYQRSYKAGSTGTLCPAPSPVPPVLTCVTGAIGIPKQNEQLLASLELKRLLPIPHALAPFGLANIGFDAKFSYDVKSDVYSFDLPLSFVPEKESKYNGGIDIGWESDSHQFVIGLFVSSAFSLAPG